MVAARSVAMRPLRAVVVRYELRIRGLHLSLLLQRGAAVAMASEPENGEVDVSEP